MTYLGRQIQPEDLVSNLQEGDVRHGLSDGSWSLIDLLRCEAIELGPETYLTIALWTAGEKDGLELRRLFDQGKIRGIRLLVDRSFPSRQPERARLFRDTWGDEHLRVWSCHAKFAVFHGGRLDVLNMFSANLNPNMRIENFTVWADKKMCEEYLEMVETAFQFQQPGEGFDMPKSARALSRYLTRGSVSGVESPQQQKQEFPDSFRIEEDESLESIMQKYVDEFEQS